ncbi:MAG: hypothetical protein ACK5JU_08010 [Bacteroidales bacterium]
MSKKNATKATTTDQLSVEDVQGVQAGESGTSLDDTQTAESTTEGAEEKVQDTGNEHSGEQTADQSGTELDTSNKEEAAGEKGDSPVHSEMSEEIADKRDRMAKKVFGKNSQCKELYFTSDIIPFFVKSDAIRHATKLKDDTIVTVKRK